MTKQGGADPPPPDWRRPEAGRLIGRGHPAGDFLEAYAWQILEQRPGYLKLEVHLPEHLKNPLGHLFGGHTPPYGHLLPPRTVHPPPAAGRPPLWLLTLQLRGDYFLPLPQERFVIQRESIHPR